MSDFGERPRAEIVLVMDRRELSVGHIPAGARCDLSLVDAILRLQLAALALGWSIRLQQVCPHLRELAEFVGCSERLGM
jgi:hypothetical protein